MANLLSMYLRASLLSPALVARIEWRERGELPRPVPRVELGRLQESVYVG